MDPYLAAIAARIETLIRALEAGPDAEARRQAVELARLSLALHGAGLARLIDIVRAQPAGATVVRQLAADPAVAMLLSLHDLHPHAASSAPPVQLARRAPDRAHGTAGACECCGAAIPGVHRHVVDLATRRLICSCQGCWLAVGTHAGDRDRRAVPAHSAPRPRLRVSAREWEALGIPVGLAFFMANSSIGRTLAFYPSPAGVVESLLPLEAWRGLTEANPWLASVAPDVEALLVRELRRGGAPAEYQSVVAPIDACYDLVGRVRLEWRGFDGGDAVRHEIDRFFADLPGGVAEPSVAVGL